MDKVLTPDRKHLPWHNKQNSIELHIHLGAIMGLVRIPFVIRIEINSVFNQTFIEALIERIQRISSIIANNSPINGYRITSHSYPLIETPSRLSTSSFLVK